MIQIFSLRERTVDKDIPDEKKPVDGEGEQTPEPTPDREVVKMPPKEIPIMTNIGEKKQVNDYWPRKMRSDITRSRVI